MDIFVDRIAPLLKSSGKTDTEIEKLLGLPRSTIYDWANGRSKSYMKHLPKIAEFCDVSTDYLLGKTDMKKAPLPEGGSANEKIDRLMERAKLLNDEHLDMVLKIAEELASKK